MTNVGFSSIKYFIMGFLQNWSNEDLVYHIVSCANSINPKIFWQRKLTQNNSSKFLKRPVLPFHNPIPLGSFRSRKVMENTKFFTKTIDFFILKFPPWSLRMAQMLLQHMFCNLLASFLNAENALLLDSKNSVHVNLEKSSTITSHSSFHQDSWFLKDQINPCAAVQGAWKLKQHFLVWKSV